MKFLKIPMRVFLPIIGTLAHLFTVTSFANADIYGRLQITVTNIDDDKPLQGADVILHDMARIRSDIRLKTDASGVVVSPLLDNRLWEVRVHALSFEDLTQQLKIASDTTSELSISLEPIEETIKVSGALTSLKPNDTSTSSTRGVDFLKRFPVTASNPQQLNGLLLSNPGFVQDSANQVHPRGEHSATSIYIQGFQLGGASQGRFGPLIDPQTLENLDIMTGGFSPEYAGGAAILNTSLRSGTAKPFCSGEIGGGNYNSGFAAMTLGGQAGAATGAPNDEGYETKVVSYFLSASGRSTDNALESPQPHNQTAHNHGDSGSFLGHFTLTPTADDKVSLIVNASPATTDIANRSGLPSKYAPYGQGYGFGGALSSEEAASNGILTQDQLGQDIYQRDQNNFGVIQWRHDWSEKTSSLFSVGVDRSKLDTLSRNPSIDLENLPEDNSIEYNPNVKRDAKHRQASGSLTHSEGSHTFRIGGQYSGENASDSYTLIPGSQLAANALYEADPRFLPGGQLLVDSEGMPVLDAQGRQVYSLDKGATSPTLYANSNGYYLAGYAQDTWRIFEDVTANYGIRYDKFHQHQDLRGDGVDEDIFSPRINLSWNFYPSWVARASHNKLFIEPPLSQGSVIGASIKPEKVNQYEGSIEKEFTPRQKGKVAYYYKDITNQVDTGLLIPSTQLGLFTSVNLDKAAVHGLEFSYELAPDHGVGTSAFLAYAYSTAKPSGFDNTGAPVEAYNDHDQRDTLTLGTAYTFDNRYALGADYYYGSGLASSVLEEGGDRHSRDRVNVSASTPSDLLFGKAGLKLTVANLFDQRDLINFNSAFSGTRFQQGRTAYLGTFFNF